MAKTKFKSNIPLVIRKIEEDLSEINLAVAGATADLVNLSMKETQKRRILDGVGKTKGRRYLEVPGANMGTKNEPDRLTFHKQKVVTRDGSIKKAFKQVSFKKHRILRPKGKIYSGSNGVAKVEIFKKGLGQMAWVEWTGNIGTALRNLQFGVASGSTIIIKNDKMRVKENKRGQRRIAEQGLRTALNRWKKLAEWRLTGTIKKRNKKKVPGPK